MKNLIKNTSWVSLTIITLLAIASLSTVFAADLLLLHVDGGNVIISGNVGEVGYNATNLATLEWTSEHKAGFNVPWYARANITIEGYTDPLAVVWKLQWYNSGSSLWADVSGWTQSTNIAAYSAGIPLTIYASTNGLIDNNKQWIIDPTTMYGAGTYRIVIDVSRPN